MSPFTLLKDYRIRRTHVADIREPLVRALWYHRYAQKCSADAGSYVSDPEAREAWDDLVGEVRYATIQCDSILAKLRSERDDRRELERLSDAPMKLHETRTTRNQMETV